MIFLWFCSTPPEVTLTPWNPTRLSGTSLFFLYTPSKHCLQTFFSHCQSEINDFFSRVFESCDHQKYANYKHMQASSRTTFKFIYPNYCTHWLEILAASTLGCKYLAYFDPKNHFKVKIDGFLTFMLINLYRNFIFVLPLKIWKINSKVAYFNKIAVIVSTSLTAQSAPPKKLQDSFEFL